MFVQSQLLSDKTINYETGLLSVESDRLNGNLTFHIKPGLSQAEIEISREFLKAIKKEFDEFKNQLIEQGISMKDFTAVLQDNKLAIHIPNPKYYDAFIKYVEKKNLLPVPNAEHEEKKEPLQSNIENKPSFNPNPFSTKLERK